MFVIRFASNGEGNFGFSVHNYINTVILGYGTIGITAILAVHSPLLYNV
jgi:hypothetical protein